MCNFTSLDTKWSKKKHTCNFTLPLQALGPMAIGYDCYRSLWNKLEKRYWKYQIKIYYVLFCSLYRPCLPSYYARMYCHLITLATSVYRKTNVFLTTVGTAVPPGEKMDEWSPLICSLDNASNTVGQPAWQESSKFKSQSRDFRFIFDEKWRSTLRLKYVGLQ